jgi:hypothetical protein
MRRPTDENCAAMKISLRTYAVVNGVFLFLILAFYVSTLRQTQIQERNWDIGDGLGFFQFAMPVLALTFLFNGYWAVKSIRDIFQRNDYRSLTALPFVVLAWVILYFASFHIS